MTSPRQHGNWSLLRGGHCERPQSRQGPWRAEHAANIEIEDDDGRMNGPLGVRGQMGAEGVVRRKLN